MPRDVYVASKIFRGPWATRPEGCETIDVTSAQGTAHLNRVTFSPMNGVPYTSPEEGTYEMGFESYWQSLKVIENVPGS